MVKKTLKRIMRAPVPGVAILLFAAIISVIICALQESNEEELRNAVEECVASEEAVKTGAIGDRLSVELLIIKYSKR